jgi:hypothetical protein
VWPNAYFLATREFAPDDSFAGVGAYALERNKMLAGDPAARMVKFLLPPGATPYLPGDGLLPSDLDGNRPPPDRSPNYFVGTQDDDGPYGAPFDAINVFQFRVAWTARPTASFVQSAQLPVAAFDSAFPCDPPDSRNCIPQPDTTQKLDILSYRQRPTWRLAYRNFGTYESLVTSQSVEARPGVAGMRWYELRRPADHPVVHQQGTYAPDDGVHRWMGSIAQDKRGNMALGYSVSNATDVFPGIRYTGRLARDPAGQMPQGEGVIVNGSGSQLTTFARWGDYTSMNVDPATTAASGTSTSTTRSPHSGAGRPASRPSACPAADASPHGAGPCAGPGSAWVSLWPPKGEAAHQPTLQIEPATTMHPETGCPAFKLPK